MQRNDSVVVPVVGKVVTDLGLQRGLRLLLAELKLKPARVGGTGKQLRDQFSPGRTQRLAFEKPFPFPGQRVKLGRAA